MWMKIIQTGVDNEVTDPDPLTTRFPNPRLDIWDNSVATKRLGATAGIPTTGFEVVTFLPKCGFEKAAHFGTEMEARHYAHQWWGKERRA